MFKPKKPIEYTITLKDGKKVVFWFIGTQIEKILKDYNILYNKVEKCKRG